jgi:hypothetical protein
MDNNCEYQAFTLAPHIFHQAIKMRDVIAKQFKTTFLPIADSESPPGSELRS